MSIKEFFQDTQVNNEFKTWLEGLQNGERQDGRDRPLIATLALVFVREGTKGLKDLSVQHGKSTLSLSPQEMQRLRMGGLEDFMAILIGNSVIGLEESFRTSKFSLHDLVERLNMSLTGTPFKPMPQPPENYWEEHLTSEKWRRMIGAAGEDPTFSVFFKKRELVPENLSRFLVSSGYSPLMDSIVAKWEDFARPLVSRVERTTISAL